MNDLEIEELKKAMKLLEKASVSPNIIRLTEKQHDDLLESKNE